MTKELMDRYLDAIDKQHFAQIAQCQRKMLKGIPRQGSIFDRKHLRVMIATAFRAGVLVERFTKAAPSKN